MIEQLFRVLLTIIGVLVFLVLALLIYIARVVVRRCPYQFPEVARDCQGRPLKERV